MLTRFRDAVTGLFTTKAKAQAAPESTVRESWHVPVPTRDYTLEDEIAAVLSMRLANSTKAERFAAARRILHIPRIKQALFALDQIEASKRNA